ncbi:phage holin family protein, partial [Pauljensenia hongkongensis]|uniref:phage holin family protein n=1 Tax=Pauljensenia hongkongensis TaxID=178339 RepID=UPI0001F666F8
TRAYAPPAQAGPARQGPGPQAAPDPGPRAGQGAQPQTGPQARRKPSVGKLIADVTSQFSSIVRGEIELAKVQTATMFARIRTGLVLMAAAAVFALFLLGWILHTIEAALATVLPVWAASLIVVGLLAVVVAVLALLGSRALRKAQESKPDPKAGITEAVHIVKNGLTK